MEPPARRKAARARGEGTRRAVGRPARARGPAPGRAEQWRWVGRSTDLEQL